MKWFMILISAILISGCADKEKLADLEARNQLLTEQLGELTAAAELRDEFITDYTQTVNSVFENLDRIRKREGFISKYSKDVEAQNQVSMQDKILSNIESIDSYIKASKKRIRDLKKKRVHFEGEAKALQETLDNLNLALETKEQETAQLRKDLESLNLRMVDAEMELTAKEDLLAAQSRRINTGYFIIGSEKELKEKGVIVEEGGLFGLRKTKKLASAFSRDVFQTTNISETENIPLAYHVGEVKLVSPHANDSFTLVEGENHQAVLEIIDPAEFWKIPYLVILTKS